ncbi:hypothetical protein PF008_g5372 [Phytophthora fragariae]|uniref:DDE Tnp4 domain-containing protein n=1 Tax=Phytophthora fragariae TaxID=53985 RepID=A0A6G0S8I8_9STRA|nr:hypothetical protein PF008_g5372 [Phytophthora fragariae]
MPRRSSRRALLSDLRTLYISFRLGNPHADHCFVSRMALRSKDLRQLVRISKRSFCSLHNYIYDNPVFHSTSRNTHHEQQPVCWQLGVGLTRLGENGNGASVGQLHRYFCIAIGSVVVYTRRVLVALKEVRLQWLAVMAAEGFPGCVGFVDGTALPLSQRPAIDGSSYFDRKKLVCDNG